jgi:hypothetical protein
MSASEDKLPLLDVLHDLGTTLVQSEIPSSAQLGQVVGAIVKVMDHAGVQVADELYPPEPAVVPRPETQQEIHRKATDSRLETLEKGLAEILGHLRGTSPAGDETEETAE